MTTTLVVRGEILGDEVDFDLEMLVRCCQLQQQQLIAMVDAGLLEPRGDQPSAWRFSGKDLKRARLAQRLTRDLGVNLEGAALIVDLLEERTALRSRMRLLNTLLDERSGEWDD